MSCTRFTRYVEFDEVVTDQELDLVGLRAEATGGARLERAWISDDVPEVSSGGTYALDVEKGRRISGEPGWATKEPLAGARLEAGTTYVVFARYRLPRRASSIGPFTMTYTGADGDEGTALWDVTATRKPGCP